MTDLPYKLTGETMYTPNPFALEDENAYDFIDTLGFGALVSLNLSGELSISHLPFSLDRSAGVLFSHVALANPHWSELEGAQVTIIFAGAQGYISPRWYQNRLSVPTWNYEAVHVHGRCATLIRDPGVLSSHLQQMTAQFEGNDLDAWRAPSDAEYAGFADRMHSGIVGFEIEINRLEGKSKLSQNRPEAEVRKIVSGLRSAGDPARQMLASRMEEALG